jgi:hypothetical protein
MAIARSGPISFSTLQGEFGGSHPISLYEYRNGGGLVTAGVSFSNYSTGISGMSLPNYTGAYKLSAYYAADVANVYTCYYSGGTSPVKTAFSFPSVSATLAVSTYLGALASGDTFWVCCQNTSGWPYGWSYPGYDHVILGCTYGSSASLTAPAYGTKQFRPSIYYDGSNTVTISGSYRGGGTNYPHGQVALQGIVRSN